MLWFLTLSVQAEEPFSEGNFPAFNIQNFRPALGRQDMLWVNETRIDKSNLFSVRNMFIYTKDPLSYKNYRGERVRILNDILETDILASYSVGIVQFGLGLPIYLRTLNDIAGGQSGIGDIWVDSKLRLSDRVVQPLGVAFSLRSTLPTSSMSVPLGTDGILFEAELDLDKRIGPTVFALNLGHRQQPSVSLENVQLGPQIFTKLGMAYHVDTRFGLSTELSASWAYSDFTNVASSPFEALFGTWRRFSDDDSWVIRGGFGLGLNEAISTPAARGLMAISYEPIPYKDSDADKISDRDDACPVESEDFDGVQDEDGCPEPTQIVFSAIDQFGEVVPDFSWVFDGGEGTQNDSASVFGGLHPVIVSATGHKDFLMELEIPDVERYDYQVPMEVLLSDLRIVAVSPSGEELLSAIWMATGKGMSANIPGSRTERVRVGSNEIIIRAPGFRRKRVDVDVLVDRANEYTIELKRSKARIQDGKISITEKVFFGQDSESILESSYDILIEVAEVMQDSPELSLIRIEGHTDSLGDEEYNIELSQKRAEAVLTFLVAQGIDISRMSAVGLGEVRPIDSNRNPNDRAKNRRVEFHVEQLIVEEENLEEQPMKGPNNEEPPEEESSPQEFSPEEESSQVPIPEEVPTEASPQEEAPVEE
jgi:outer membrane protein OmpA-like peptidoglycan-associated protein